MSQTPKPYEDSVHTAFVCIVWPNSHTLCWMRFSVRISAHVFTTSQSLAFAFFLEQCSEQVVIWLTNYPLAVICLSLHRGKDKSPFVLMVGKCCRFVLLNVTQESRAINCTMSPLKSPACFMSQAAASLSNAFALS